MRHLRALRSHTRDWSGQGRALEAAGAAGDTGLQEFVSLPAVPPGSRAAARAEKPCPASLRRVAGPPAPTRPARGAAPDDFCGT